MLAVLCPRHLIMDATELRPAGVRQYWAAASRVNPTCSVKPGHDAEDVACPHNRPLVPIFNCQTAACFPWCLTKGHNPSPAHARCRSACAPSPFGRGKRGCFTARRITIQLSNSQASSPCFFAAPGTPSSDLETAAPGKEPRARGTPGVLRTHGPRRLATSRLVESCRAASPPNPKASRARCL